MDNIVNYCCGFVMKNIQNTATTQLPEFKVTFLLIMTLLWLGKELEFNLNVAKSTMLQFFD